MNIIANTERVIPDGEIPNPAAWRQAFDLCVDQTRGNIQDLADHPETWSNDVDGRYENFKEDFYAIGNWTTSFFTGMALLAWRETADEYFLSFRLPANAVTVRDASAAAVAVCGFQELQKPGAADALILNTKEAWSFVLPSLLKAYEWGAGKFPSFARRGCPHAAWKCGATASPRSKQCRH